MGVQLALKLKNYPDKMLLNMTEELVQKERALITEVLYHLREIESRRLYSQLGYSSLYNYCTQHLHYSESQAHYRITAMRMTKQVPEIESKLNKGELSLSSVSKVQSFIRAEEKINKQKISLKQKKDLFNKVTNLSVKECEKALIKQSSQPKRIMPDRVKVVAPQRVQIQFVANEKLLNKFQRIKGLLAHKYPHLNYEELMDILCDTTLDKIDPLRQKNTRSVRSVSQKKSLSHMTKAKCRKNKMNSDRTKRAYMSMKVKKFVWEKSQGKCEICASQYALEIDHIMPKSYGGNDSVENLRLICRSCNQREAIKKLGQAVMDPFLNK